MEKKTHQRFLEAGFSKDGIVIYSLNPRLFWKNFIVLLVEMEGDHYFKQEHFNIRKDTYYTLLSAAKELMEKDVPIDNLNKLLGKFSKEEKDAIKNQDLSEEKIENFFSDVEKGYKEENKILSLSGSFTTVGNSDQGMGFYISETREHFIEGEFHVEAIGHDDYGKGIAQEENNFAIDKIKETVGYEEINFKKLLYEKLPHFSRSEGYVFFTNIIFDAYRVISSSGGDFFTEAGEVEWDSINKKDI